MIHHHHHFGHHHHHHHRPILRPLPRPHGFRSTARKFWACAALAHLSKQLHHLSLPHHHHTELGHIAHAAAHALKGIVRRSGILVPPHRPMDAHDMAHMAHMAEHFAHKGH